MPSCSTCIHNRVCAIYKSAIQTKASFDAEFEGTAKLPMIPDNLAIGCSEYLPPKAEGFLNNPEGV